MSNQTENEKKALEIMQKDNFRGISKDNVMQLMSIIDKVDPEVAKAIIAQLPEVIQGTVETDKAYSGLLVKGLDSCEKSTSSCFATEDNLIEFWQKEATKEGVTFEERKYYSEKMEAAAIGKEGKDTEHKSTVLTTLKYGGEALTLSLCVIAGIYIGKADIKLPIKK